jgi:hypothetical protein
MFLTRGSAHLVGAVATQPARTNAASNTMPRATQTSTGFHRDSTRGFGPHARCATGPWRNAADVRDREGLPGWGRRAPRTTLGSRDLVWSRFDARRFRLGPIDRPVRTCRRCNGASASRTPTCPRSSEPGRGGPAGVVQISRLSANTSGAEQKPRSVELRRRLKSLKGGRVRRRPSEGARYPFNGIEIVI